MSVKVMAVDKNGNRTVQYLDRLPDKCPLCHHNIKPVAFRDNVGHFLSTNEASLIQLVYSCPRDECDGLFIAYYASSKPVTHSDQTTFYLGRCAPTSRQKARFSEHIATTSPDFVAIYNQAAEAEARGLERVAGPGYRKALEFLIKDYLIATGADAEAEIKRKFLGRCINDYVKDDRLNACAKRAAWLGNDETHYKRKWVDKDLEDLKLLIKLTVRWVEAELLTKEYEQRMAK